MLDRSGGFEAWLGETIPDAVLDGSFIEWSGEGRPEDKRRRTARPLRIIPGIDLHRDVAKRGKRVLAELVLEGLAQMRPGQSPFTTDDDELRTEDIHKACDGPAEEPAGARVERAGAEVARIGQAAEDGHGGAGVRVRGDKPDVDRFRYESWVGDERLEAPMFATLAGGAVINHRDVAELAGAATGASVQVASNHDPEPDAAADRHCQHMIESTPAAVQSLGHGEGIDVVVDQDRHSEPLLQCRAEGNGAPPEDGGLDDATLGVNDARHAEADTQEPCAAALGNDGGQAISEPRKGVRRRCVERLVVAGEDLAVETRPHDGEPIGSDLGPEGLGGISNEPEEDRRAPAIRWRLIHLPDEPVLEEVARKDRHGRGAECQFPGDLDSGDRAAAPDQGEDGRAVQVPAERSRALAQASHGTSILITTTKCIG